MIIKCIIGILVIILLGVVLSLCLYELYFDYRYAKIINKKSFKNLKHLDRSKEYYEFKYGEMDDNNGQ